MYIYIYIERERARDIDIDAALRELVVRERNNNTATYNESNLTFAVIHVELCQTQQNNHNNNHNNNNNNNLAFILSGDHDAAVRELVVGERFMGGHTARPHPQQLYFM